MRALLPPSFAAAVVASSVVATTCGAAGCATTPSPEDRKAAGGHYEVALAFVLWSEGRDGERAARRADAASSREEYVMMGTSGREAASPAYPIPTW